MPTENIGADLGTMHGAAQHVRDVNQQIQTELSSLMGRLDPLTSTWKGQAAVAFHRLRARWNDDAVKLNDALSHIASAIEASKTTYQTRDQAGEQNMSAIASALG